jgi:hypothetical protein
MDSIMHDLKRKYRKSPQAPSPRRSTPITIRKSGGKRLMVMPDQIKAPARRTNTKKFQFSPRHLLSYTAKGITLLIKKIPTLSVSFLTVWLGYGCYEIYGDFYLDNSPNLKNKFAASTSGESVSIGHGIIRFNDVNQLEFARQTGWIAGAHTRHYYPNNGFLQIDRKKPHAVIEYKNKLYYVDRTLFPFETIKVEDIKNLPIIRGLEDDFHHLKESFRLDQALHLQYSLPRDIVKRIQYIDVKEPLNVKVKFFNFSNVFYLGGVSLSEKVRLASQLDVDYLNNTGGTKVVDIQYDDRLILRN